MADRHLEKMMLKVDHVIDNDVVIISACRTSGIALVTVNLVNTGVQNNIRFNLCSKNLARFLYDSSASDDDLFTLCRLLLLLQ